MRLEDLPLPVPGTDEVLLRIKAIGVNPVDTYIRAGTYGKIPLPYTPGFDAAGVIEGVGPNVQQFRLGDRVYAAGTSTGAYAEAALSKTAQVYPLPDNISFAQGAALGIPYATAYRALFQRARAVPGEVVLIHGASGGVGLAAVQLARAAGLKVIGTAGTESGRVVVTLQGAHHALDHHRADYLAQIKALSQDRGVDVILEMLANLNLGKDLTILARGGRVVVVGSRGNVEITPREAMSRDAAILGMTLFNASPAELASIHAALRAGLENQTLRPVIAKELPLSEAAAAHKLVMEPGAHGKIILVPEGKG